MTFLFPFPSHFYRIIPIPIPIPSVLWHCWLGHLTRKNPSPYDLYCVGGTLSLTQSINHPSIPIPTLHSHSHFRQRLYIDYLKAEKYVYSPRPVNVSWIQNRIWSYSRSIVNRTHHSHSSVIIIIIITAYHCSLFNVCQTVTACYCAKISRLFTLPVGIL